MKLNFPVLSSNSFMVWGLIKQLSAFVHVLWSILHQHVASIQEDTPLAHGALLAVAED